MPQIEVPFLPGDKVRVEEGTGTVYTVNHLEVGDGTTAVWVRGQFDVVPYRPEDLEAVKPVIEWKRDPVYDCWRGSPWAAFDSGRLWWKEFVIGAFSDPRAVAEETQTLWNERAASNEREGE